MCIAVKAVTLSRIRAYYVKRTLGENRIFSATMLPLGTNKGWFLGFRGHCSRCACAASAKLNGTLRKCCGETSFG